MFTSVQNRLLRARNQMISKSIKETEFKPYTPSEILKVGLVKQPLPHKCKQSKFLDIFHNTQVIFNINRKYENCL